VRAHRRGGHRQAAAARERAQGNETGPWGAGPDHLATRRIAPPVAAHIPIARGLVSVDPVDEMRVHLLSDAKDVGAEQSAMGYERKSMGDSPRGNSISPLKKSEPAKATSSVELGTADRIAYGAAQGAPSGQEASATSARFWNLALGSLCA
jgi:hypothetical protein